MTEVRDFARGDKGRVYVIGCQVGCKIGWTSKDPRDRVRALQTGNPYPIHLAGSVPGGLDMEAAAHERFDDYRMSGEWFDVNPFDALMWLVYEGGSKDRIRRKRLALPFRPVGCAHGVRHALTLYGHGESTVWTMDGIVAVLGRSLADDELDDMLYDKRLFSADVVVGGRSVRLYSLESFGDDGNDYSLPTGIFDA
jgi:hypothetical protein